MSQLRQPFSELSPEVYKGLVQASLALEKSELGSALVELVYLRVSQINGCAFCLEKHSQALRTLNQAVTKEAQVRAYNDVIFLNQLFAVLLLIWGLFIISINRYRSYKQSLRPDSS